MFNVQLSRDRDIGRAIRALDTETLDLFNAEVTELVAPTIEQDVQQLFAIGPGASRFETFATDRSRKFFFWAFRGKLPFQRTGLLEQSWKVALDRRRNEGYMTIINDAEDDLGEFRSPSRYAVFVYPALNPLAINKQVPGHAETGWGQDFPSAIELVQEHLISLLIDAWVHATDKALL